MRKTIFIMLCLLGSVRAFCQGPAGINTSSPKQALQISGVPAASTPVGTTGKYVVTPTLRAEGLNATNNQAHPADPNNPAYSVQPVYATSTGDLVIGRKYTTIEQTLPGGNAFGVLIDSVPANTAMAITPPLYTTSFTLAQPSLVYISASLTLTITDNPMPPAQYDGRAKMAGIQFVFSSVPAGSGIPTTYFAASSWPVLFPPPERNGSPGSGYGLNLAKVIRLPAGAYTFNILGFAGSASPGPYTIDFGDGENFVNITAIPL